MTSYPYGADERFPEGDIHLDYERRFNIRPARQINPPLRR
jgi:hypothetical protein